MASAKRVREEKRYREPGSVGYFDNNWVVRTLSSYELVTSRNPFDQYKDWKVIVKLTILALFFIILQSCNTTDPKQVPVVALVAENHCSTDSAKVTENSSSSDAWMGLGLEYVNYQVINNLHADHMYLDLAGLDSMTYINWHNVNPKSLELFFPESQVTILHLDFQKFDRLETLTLSKSQIEKLPRSLKYLKNLKKLYIYGSQIREFPSELCTLTGLEELTIWRSRLSSLPSEISHLTKLTTMNLIENNLSATERIRIQKLLPNCEISFEY